MFIVLLWAEEIMTAETEEEARAIYARTPRLLKDKVDAVLRKNGFDWIIQ